MTFKKATTRLKNKLSRLCQQLSSKPTKTWLIISLLGLTIGLTVGLKRDWLKQVLALNDTTKTWSFTSATSGDYTFDSNLITVDNNGATVASGANELTNPAFASDNSSWSVAALPPSNWLAVPGNGTYSTNEFLVMKYEAKCAATSNPSTGLTSPSTGASNQTYDNSTTACTNANSRQVVSLPDGYPIARINHNDAVAYCSNVSINGSATHLITNPEWMTIARNAEAQDGNWTTGTVGSGSMFSGHNDNNPGYALQASSNDNNPYYLTGNSDPSGQKRTLTLSNNQVIWDFPGNVWEHVNKTVEAPAGMPYDGSPASEWLEFTDITGYGNTLAYDDIRPSSSSYNSGYGVGKLYTDYADTGTRVFLRGGNWNSGSNTGAFSLSLTYSTASQNYDVGFRCASDPVAISQSFSSSSGREATGGNSVAVGNITTAKLYQSINVGDTGTYNLSAYVYDNTVGNVGGTVSTSIAQLYYNGSTISTTYTDQGNGWWKLSGSVTGANQSREYGLQVAAGKTVKVDDFTLAKDTEYSLYTTTAYTNSQVTTWDSLSTTSTTNGDASLSYQLCTDDGSTCETGAAWKYWDGSAWQTAINTTTNTNTEAELTTTAMQALPVSSQKISVKVIIGFGGADRPDLDDLSIGLTTDTTAPTTNASSLTMSKQAGGESVSSNGWTNNSSPYFSWTAGADDSGGTGIKGYCLYLGTDANGNPATSKGLLGTSPVSTAGSTCGFIINATSIDFATSSYRGGTWLSSSDNPYYLNIKAIDEAENIFSGSSQQFQFHYDNSSPSNPSGLSAPSEYKQSVDSFTVAWATSGGTAGSDSNSGIKGYQYKLNNGTWYGSSHSGNEDCADVITTGSYTLNGTNDTLSKGENTFYLRTIDNACNIASSNVTGILKYNADAPSSPQNLAVDPSSNTSNSFAFSWSAPATYSGAGSGLSYCYTINTVPSSVACTFTSNTSLSADSYATQPDTNTFYLTAKDEAGNINYANYASVSFTANTSAPSVAREMAISDVSIKSTSNWKLALSWEAPSSVGAGIDSYQVYRSTSSTSCSSSFSGFSQLGTTSGTSYVDSGLSQDDYYYCVKACDSANNCSAVSETVTDYPTGKYETAASLTSGPTVSNLTTKRAKISWSTGRNSDSKVAYGTSESDYFDEEPSVSTQTTDHVINLTNLNPGTTYYYQTKWTDGDGNTGTSQEKSFTTDPPPEVKDVQVKSVNLSSALIEFTTKDAEKVEFYYGETTSFGGLKTISTSTAESTYTTQLSGLDDGTKYYFKLNVFDAENDEYEGTILDFETPPSPKISNVQLQQVRNTAQSTILSTWISNTPISSIVTFWPQNSPDQARDEVEVALKEGSHRMIVRGLLPNTLYSLVVKGRDKLGNQATSDQHQFTTATDTRPPQISNLTVEGKNIPPTESTGQKTYAQLIVAWQTDEPASSQVEFGEGAGENYSQSSQRDDNLTLDHLIVISNMTPSKVYHLRAISEDKVGNESHSVDTVTIAPKATDNALNLVITNLQDAFGFLGRLKK